jgi:hypothetical protein
MIGHISERDENGKESEDVKDEDEALEARK